MKHRIVYLAIAILPAIHTASAGWTRAYGGEYSESGMCVRVTADGGYVIAGYAYSDSDPDMWVFKIDSSGNIQWSKLYGTNGYEWANAIVQTEDGGYAVVGKNGGECCLLRLDNKGDTIWTKSYKTEYGSEGFWLEQSGDGGYIIAGTMWLYDTTGCGRSTAWLLKTDFAGDTIWTRTCGYSEVNKAQGVCLAPDGGYVVTGVLNSKLCGGGYAWWCKFDSLGQQVWSYDFSVGSVGSISYGNSVRPTSDKGYIMAGPGWSLKTDSLGRTQWMKVDQNAQDYSAIEVQSGSHFFAGSDYGNFSLRRRGPKGYEDWTKHYGFGTCYCIQKAIDGGYIEVGYRQNAYDNDVFLVKTDANGDTLGICEPATPITHQPSSEMEIVRSIGSGIVLRYSLSLSDRGGFKLFDASGRMVESFSVSGQGEVKVAGLSAGVYFARLEAVGAGVTKKMVVVR